GGVSPKQGPQQPYPTDVKKPQGEKKFCVSLRRIPVETSGFSLVIECDSKKMTSGFSTKNTCTFSILFRRISPGPRAAYASPMISQLGRRSIWCRSHGGLTPAKCA